MISAARTPQDPTDAVSVPPMLNPRLVRLTCFGCAQEYSPNRWHGVCPRCESTLGADYERSGDLPGTGSSLWRYESVLPVDSGHAVSLGEGWTPLLEISERVLIKDEADNPTGSFKDRGMSVAVSAAISLGASGLAAPSAGNAADSLALYGAAAGIPVLVAMPDDTPKAVVDSCRAHGATVELISGTIAEAGSWLADHLPAGFVDVSTLREPYRLEGKKTLAYSWVAPCPM